MDSKQLSADVRAFLVSLISKCMYHHYSGDEYKKTTVEDLPDLLSQEIWASLSSLWGLGFESEMEGLLKDAKRERASARVWEEDVEDEKDEWWGDQEGDDDDHLSFCPDLSEMPYYPGRITPCPLCGSTDIESYVDGSAYCHHCKRWYRYE